MKTNTSPRTPFEVAFEANPFVRAGKAVGEPMTAAVDRLKNNPVVSERTNRLTKQIQNDVSELRAILSTPRDAGETPEAFAKRKLEKVIWRLTGLGAVPENQVHASRGERGVTHAALALVAANLVTSAQHLNSPEAVLAAAGAALAGYVAAEFGSNPFHRLVDNLEERENMPAALKEMIRTFQWHHIEPTRESQSAFARSAAPGAAAMLLPLAGALATHWSMPVDMALVAAAAGVIFSTENHKMAHRPPNQVPTLYKAAKLFGLSLDDKEHQQHHTFPFHNNSGIINGTSDFFLEGPAARKAEALMYKITGQEPHTWRYDPSLMQEALGLDAPEPEHVRAAESMKQLLEDTRGTIGPSEIRKLRQVLPTLVEKEGQWVIEKLSPDSVDIPLLDESAHLTRLARRILGATVPHPQMFDQSVDWK
jgi:hypothetical protein